MEDECVCVCEARRVCVSSSLASMGFEIELLRLEDLAVRERRGREKRRVSLLLSLGILSNGFAMGFEWRVVRVGV